MRPFRHLEGVSFGFLFEATPPPSPPLFTVIPCFKRFSTWWKLPTGSPIGSLDSKQFLLCPFLSMAYHIRSHHKRTGCLDIAENLICLLIIQIKVNPAMRDVCLASFKRI